MRSKASAIYCASSPHADTCLVKCFRADSLPTVYRERSNVAAGCKHGGRDATALAYARMRFTATVGFTVVVLRR